MNFMFIVIIIIVLVMVALMSTIYFYNRQNNFKQSSNFIKNSGVKRKINKTAKDELEERFAKAGLFTEEAKARFNRNKMIISFVSTLIGVILAISLRGVLGIFFAIACIYIGIKIPNKILNNKAKERDEDILYYLPLVIEQLIVGVSSALDIGPCINYVVEMAEKRGTHNVVTLLLKQVQTYVKYGASLDDALQEVGRKSEHVELKNSFIQLSQVSKHGGEITKQLQDLGSTVARQREVIIDGRIRVLELKATGPVFIVFAGHMLILVSFLIMGLISGLKNM